MSEALEEEQHVVVVHRKVKLDQFHANMANPNETPLDQEVEQVDQKQPKSAWNAVDRKAV